MNKQKRNAVASNAGKWPIPERTKEQRDHANRTNRGWMHVRAASEGHLGCAICGIICSNPRVLVRCGFGGGYLCSNETANTNPSGDLGMYPIGSDCWRKYKTDIIAAGVYVEKVSK